MQAGILSAQEVAAHSALSLFQKILLSSDGTVTELLSLYAGEPIKARKLVQSVDHENVLHRQIMLCGLSGRDYLYAQSSFKLARLPASVQHGLLHTDQPIGLLWREAQLEMYRDITERKLGPFEAAAQSFGLPAHTPMLARTYVIVHTGVQCGVITECFPLYLLR